MKNKFALTVLVILLVYFALNGTEHSIFRNNFLVALTKHYPWTRVRGYINFYQYWQGYMDELTYEPEKKIYSFERRIDQTFADNQWKVAGLLALHQGLLTDSINYLTQNQTEDEDTHFWLAMAYLKRGMNQTCFNADITPENETPRCSLPIRYTKGTPNKDLVEAGNRFDVLLKTGSEENNTRYRWLRKLAGALNGTKSKRSSIIQRRNLSTDQFNVEHHRREFSQFSLTERGKQLGVDTFDAGKGVAVEDFDRDGNLDIVAGGFYGPSHFYRNIDGSYFVDESEKFGLSEIKGAHIITAADYDNDGWVDLFISHPTGTLENGGFSLLRNDNGIRFVNVTQTSGLLSQQQMRDHGSFTWTSAWGDVDNDGDLDLFVANWGGKQLISGTPALDSTLYINENGRFYDASVRFGLEPLLKNNLVVGAAFGDYDNDGDADLALASMLPGFPMLFENINGNHFVANSSVKTDRDGGFTISFVDINHDGQLDIFRGVALLPESNIASASGKISSAHGHSLVWLQKSGNQFELSQNYFGPHQAMASMGANFGDLNNDGAYDFYLGTGCPHTWVVVPNLLYLGTTTGHKPSERLIDVNDQYPVGTLAKGHGIVFFDFDNDGDQDLYSSLGGMWPGDRWPNEFFVNESKNQNAWVKIRLLGQQANYYGLGSMIRVRAKNNDNQLIVRYYLMDNKTGFGSAPYLAHIGLSDASEIVDVAVKWPGKKDYISYPANIGDLNIIQQ